MPIAAFVYVCQNEQCQNIVLMGARFSFSFYICPVCHLNQTPRLATTLTVPVTFN
jgi:hypothetical protein